MIQHGNGLDTSRKFGLYFKRSWRSYGRQIAVMPSMIVNAKEHRVKKSLLSLGLALVLALTCAAVQAAPAVSPDKPANESAANPTGNPAGNPVDQFTGEIWVNSPASDKLAYLFGIDSAVAVEYFINSELTAKAAKAGKKPVYTLSPFEKGWMKAFANMSRSDISKLVDEWYANNPKELQRPVLNVMWYELIAPRLAAPKK